MWKVVLVDDEAHAISRLTRILSMKDRPYEIIRTCGSVEEAISALEETEPDLIFLDIALGNASGFDLLRRLPSIDFDIVFTTAHNQYAVEAFEFSALHYLLKPITEESLEKALSRFEDKVGQRQTDRRLDNLLYNLEVHSAMDKKIAAPGVNGISFYKIGEILRLEADGNYTHIHLNSGEKHLVTRRLKYYEELLDHRSFFRVHQTHLVHLSYVEKFVKGKQSYLLLSNGEKVPVATRKREVFLDQLAKNKQI